MRLRPEIATLVGGRFWSELGNWDSDPLAAAVETRMTIPRKDHFIPQGYLRGFIQPKRRRERKPLWVLDVSTRTWSTCGTKDFAFGRGFYDGPVVDSGHVVPDDIFRKLENDFPRSRDALRRRGYDSWPEAKEIFVCYAAMLSARSPLFLRQAASAASVTAQAESNLEGRGRAITMMSEEIPRRCERWMQLHWALRYTTDPNSPVICCDQSVGMEGQLAPDRLTFADPLAHPDTLLFFPLGWDMCLVGSPARFVEESQGFVEQDLSRLRQYLVQQAERFVVSPVRLASLG